MDDFGSGYSSLSLLREMPVDVLKLDKGFLDGCHGNEKSDRDKRILYHIISMAKDLEITVLAEGVETEQQKDFLKEVNCDLIQGYFYSKPMTTDRFAKYLEPISAKKEDWNVSGLLFFVEKKRIMEEKQEKKNR